MSIGTALTIASGSLGNVSAQFALIGHNVANASTPDYAVETMPQESLVANGVGQGAVDQPVQAAVDQQGDILLIACVDCVVILVRNER